MLPRINALPQSIQPLMLDMCVNHGAGKAIKIMQRVINQAGIEQVMEDGICGPSTQHAAQRTQEAMGVYFQNALVDERINFYRQIVSHTPSQLVFLRGWERRAESFRVVV
jgi:lysozyme family protein